ncbi:hypothetical protein GBA52_009002 [Prunus armeniaca]|nr:hypothetical protein GBA52_009002 [Prunus armeniaca]
MMLLLNQDRLEETLKIGYGAEETRDRLSWWYGGRGGGCHWRGAVVVVDGCGVQWQPLTKPLALVVGLILPKPSIPNFKPKQLGLNLSSIPQSQLQAH